MYSQTICYKIPSYLPSPPPEIAFRYFFFFYIKSNIEVGFNFFLMGWIDGEGELNGLVEGKYKNRWCKNFNELWKIILGRKIFNFFTCLRINYFKDA